MRSTTPFTRLQDTVTALVLLDTYSDPSLCILCMTMYLHGIQYGLKKSKLQFCPRGLVHAETFKTKVLLPHLSIFYSSYVPETGIAQNRMR
jgi:hypothetical protein